LLAEHLSDSLRAKFGKIQVAPLSQSDQVTDGTTVLMVRDAAGEPRAVVLCAAPASPDLMRRAMERARQAKSILDPSTGAHILDPLAEGKVGELSYAVLPYCKQLSNAKPIWWLQRALLRRAVLDWLYCLTERTVRKVDREDVDRRFGAPLRHVASHTALSSAVRQVAERAAERVHTGAWSPRHVLMHGDLWKGNILMQPAGGPHEIPGWRNRFVVIDWPGSETAGYAMFDLVRLSASMGLGPLALRQEMERHCRLLECSLADAPAHLAAALGHIGMNLEHFPVHRYARMADSCLAYLARAID
jgi:hypothetical protein